MLVLSALSQSNCDFHNASCCQLLATGARTAGADLRLVIAFQSSPSGFLRPMAIRHSDRRHRSGRRCSRRGNRSKSSAIPGMSQAPQFSIRLSNIARSCRSTLSVGCTCSPAGTTVSFLPRHPQPGCAHTTATARRIDPHAPRASVSASLCREQRADM